VTEPRDNTKLHVSSLAYCQQRNAYRLQYPLHDSKVTLNSEMGTTIHRYLQESVRRSMPDVGIEVPVSFEPVFPVIGKADLVTVDTVIDIKSHSPYARVPNAIHYLQVASYCLALNKPMGCLCYVERGCLTPKFVYFNPLAHKNHVELLLQAARAIYNNKDTAIATPSRSECSYCEFSHICSSSFYKTPNKKGK
jgi:CRISPR/Cas system-associated exonuclease Cas4 (RecB family)